MNETEPPHPGRGAIGVAITAGALALCCTGPALIAGGALSTIGRALSNPIVITVGVALTATAIAIAIAITLRRRTQSAAAKPGDNHC